MDERADRSGIGGMVRRWVLPIVLVASGAVVGGAIAGGGIAAAANDSGSGSGGSSGAAATAPWNGMNPADMTHGPGEKLLTGSVADKVTAAAEDAVPNGTVIRVETDSDGSAYEAHMQKADGSYVTVKVDDSFNVTSTEDGFGPGPQGTGSSNPSSGSNA